MLSWISDLTLTIMSWVPPWLYPEDSSRYVIVRGMFALLLIVLVVLVIALRPVRTFIASYRNRRGSPNRDPAP